MEQARSVLWVMVVLAVTAIVLVSFNRGPARSAVVAGPAAQQMLSFNPAPCPDCDKQNQGGGGGSGFFFEHGCTSDVGSQYRISYSNRGTVNESATVNGITIQPVTPGSR